MVGHTSHIEIVEIDADIDLAGGDAVDADTAAWIKLKLLERSYTSRQIGDQIGGRKGRAEYVRGRYHGRRKGLERTNLSAQLHRTSQHPKRHAKTWYNKVPNTLPPIPSAKNPQFIKFNNKHTTIPPRHTPHNNNTPIPNILNLRIRIIPLLTQLPHRRRRILEREKRRIRVRFEAFLQVRGSGVAYGGGPEQPRTADPDVEPAPGVEDVVD